MKPNVYLLPLISDMMVKLKRLKFFTKLDLRWGYNNIQIKEGDEWKAAFVTRRGLFEPTVMFFGLCNSPATFQRMMDNLFEPLIRQGIMIVYIDDIFVFGGTTLDEHRSYVTQVFQILSDNHLCVAPDKCHFETPEVSYLGFKV